MLNLLKMNLIKYPYTFNCRMDSRLMTCLQYSQLFLVQSNYPTKCARNIKFSADRTVGDEKNDYIFHCKHNLEMAQPGC